MKHADDTRNLNLLADQLEALRECAEVAALAAGGLSADMDRHGEHPSLVGALDRVRNHLTRVLAPLGAAQGLLGSVMDTREGQETYGPQEPVQAADVWVESDAAVEALAAMAAAGRDHRRAQ